MWELYLKPAAERAAALKADKPDRPPANAVPAPGGVPSKAAFVASMTAEFGPSPDYPAAWEQMFGTEAK